MRWPNPPRAPVDRLAAADLMQWQADVGPVPHHVGGLLILADDARPTPQVLLRTVATRLGAVPPLRGRPVRPALGAGGWYWRMDDVDPGAHVTAVGVPASGTGQLLVAAMRALSTRMPPGRPPWSATVLVGDGAGRPGRPGRRARRRPAPCRVELTGPGPAPRSVLNRPCGGRRQVDLVDLDEATLVATARSAGGSVNDVVLVAAVAALAAAAADAGEVLDHLVVSVPVAVRGDRPWGARSPRNAVRVMQHDVPATGPLHDRVRQVTARRQARLRGSHGESLPLVPNQGNTTAAFAARRYAGRLTVAVTTDPDVGPDGAVLARRLSAALADLAPPS